MSFSRPAFSPISVRLRSRLAPLGPWTALLLGLLCAASATAQGLFVDSFSPTSGDEGTLVQITGGGFSTDPEDHYLFVHDSVSGLGAVLDPVASTDGSLDGLLGPTPGPFSGRLTVWPGSRFKLPSAVIPGETGVFLVQKAQWFVPSDAVDGPRLFHVLDSSSGTVGSIPLVGGVVVSFSELAGGPDPTKINLNVVIDGGSAGGDNPTGPTEDLGYPSLRKRSGTSTPARALSLVLDRVEPTDGTVEAFVRDLARVLKRTFGPFGLLVDAQDADLHISWTGAPSPVRGFAVLQATP